MNETLERLESLLKQANYPVIITGAGISTLSGIPDYSSMEGIMTEMGYLTARQLLTSGFCYGYHDDFVEWFVETFYQDKQPNKVHEWITKMSDEIDNLVVLTQNVDGLQNANHLIEYHGNAHEWKCEKCHKIISKEEAKEDGYSCIDCDHIMQPNIVLYGQFIDPKNSHAAEKACRQSDCMLVLGTSLDVAPFNDLVLDRDGSHIYWVDKKAPNNWYDHQDINIIKMDLNDLF